MFPDPIETDSLELTRLSRDSVDVLDLYELFAAGSDSASGVFEFIPQEPFTTPKDAHEWLEDAETSWENREISHYAVYADDELAGTTALNIDWDRQKANLGLILARPYWGEGYAGECARALIELAFDTLDLEVVTIGYDEGNDRSEHVIERIIDEFGGQYDGVVPNATPRDAGIADAYNYSITREQYRRQETGD